MSTRLQMRPKNGDERLYAPDRDLAWLGIPLIRSVLGSLAADPSAPDGLEEYLLAAGVTDSELGDVARALAGFLSMVPREDVDNAAVAWDQSGLDKTLPAARAAIYARLGRRLLVLIFDSMRDVTPLGGEPRGVAELTADAARMEQRIKHYNVWWRRLLRLVGLA